MARTVASVTLPEASSTALAFRQRHGACADLPGSYCPAGWCRRPSASASSSCARVSTSTSILTIWPRPGAQPRQRRGDAAGGGDMIVLDQRGVIQAEAVVEAAAAAHGIFLQGAQAGQGLAGADDARLGALHRLDQRRRGGGDAGQMAQEIQRHPLGGQDGAGRAADGGQQRAGCNVAAVRRGDLECERADRPAGTRPRRRSGRRWRRACAPPAGRVAVCAGGNGELAGDVAGAAQIFFQRARAPAARPASASGGRVKSSAITAAHLRARRRQGVDIGGNPLGIGQGHEGARAVLARSAENRCANGRRGIPCAPAPPPSPAWPPPVMLSSAGSALVVSSRAITSSAWRRPSSLRSSPTWRLMAPRSTCGGAGEAKPLRRRRHAAHRARRQLAAHIVGDAGAEHQAFQQRVGGQPVGAMQAGGGAFAHHPQARQRRAALRVGGDAAHVIMGGRRHRDGLARRIDARRHAGGIDGGKMLREFRADGLAAIQKDFVAAQRSGDGWRGPRYRAAPVRHRHGCAVMKRSPWSLTSTAPSPRSASVASGAGSRPMAMAVGWNWTNSGSAISAPARAAMPRPSPRASSGLVVTA